MSTRTAIAAAATLAEVSNVTEYYRQSLKPGDGFVRFAGRAPDTSGFGWIDTWEVWLALPENPVAAEKWITANLDALVTATQAAIAVTAAEPATLVLGQNSVNGLIIRGAAAAQ